MSRTNIVTELGYVDLDFRTFYIFTSFPTQIFKVSYISKASKYTNLEAFRKQF